MKNMSKTIKECVIALIVGIAILAPIVIPAWIAWNERQASGNVTTKGAVPTSKQSVNDDVFVWTDEETGVQYVVYSESGRNNGMGGITPRLNADGTVCVAE